MNETERPASSLLLEASDYLDRLRRLWRAFDMMMVDLSDPDEVGAFREVSEHAIGILDHARDCLERGRHTPVEEPAQ